MDALATEGGFDVRRATPRAMPAARQATVYAPLTTEQIDVARALLQRFKSDPRGPYLRIRWFCEDGSVLAPTPNACAEHGGGHQRAQFTPAARRLADLGFHVGTILMAMSYEEFHDLEHANYRLRELVVEHYLQQFDDGWVLRRARFYRGARQIEDEERRGRHYLETLLADREWRARNPLLATQLALLVPHGQAGIPGQRMRSLAAGIAELDPKFQDLRIKIHSRPGPGDLGRVAAYRAGLPPSAAAALRAAVDELHDLLASLYTSSAFQERLEALATPLRGTTLGPRVLGLAKQFEEADARHRVKLLAGLTRDARRVLAAGNLAQSSSEGAVALAVLDFVNYSTALLTTAANAWVQEHVPHLEMTDELGGVDAAGHLVAVPPPIGPAAPPSRADLLDFLVDLLDATYGSGLLFDHEYEALQQTARVLAHPRSRAPARTQTRTRTEQNATSPTDGGSSAHVSAADYNDRIQYLSHALDWAQATVQQTFGMALERYSLVEPMTLGVRDEALRSSTLLPYAAVVDVLARDATLALGLPHSVFDVELHTGIMGLNPGVALGRLSVIDKPEDLRELDPDGIYVLPETPADLGRVAGILTLEEGSRLSHIQLLARSLGLPNAVVDPALVSRLRKYDGAVVFYAVSPLGTVVLKRTEAMTRRDRVLLGQRSAAGDEQLSLDPSKLDLDVRHVLQLEEVDLSDSGRSVGPKAANLGRLRRLFPDRVAPGLVIPFGIFRQHIDRDLRGSGRTLYEDLLAINGRVKEAVAAGSDAATINRWLPTQLEQVQEAIIEMDLLPQFSRDIRAALRRQFGPDGTYGVFVRSDTNVEDLPSFTGAGLNLTVMNQIGTEEILSAIKRVWASPFSARSYTWRQRLLATPEHVYPSVILLRSVQVDASGVLATIDLAIGRRDSWTVTLAEGVGGVVEGEPAETMLVPLTPAPPMLLSSARAVWQTVFSMAGSGGVERVPVRGDPVLLTPARLSELRQVMIEILDRYPPMLNQDRSPMPWDLEFGFVGDRLMLFQIRPLVSNRVTEMLRALAAMDNAALAGGSALLALDRPPKLQ